MPEHRTRYATVLPPGRARQPVPWVGKGGGGVGGAKPSHPGAALPALPCPARRRPAPTSGLTGSDVALTEKARLQPKKRAGAEGRGAAGVPVAGAGEQVGGRRAGLRGAGAGAGRCGRDGRTSEKRLRCKRS